MGAPIGNHIPGVPGGEIYRLCRTLNVKPKRVSRRRIYPAKTFYTVFCEACNSEGLVTCRMLRAGNAGRLCKHKSLRDLSPEKASPAAIARRFKKLEITSEKRLKDFDSRFHRLVAERLGEVEAQARGYKSGIHTRSLDLQKKALIQLLGKAQSRRELYSRFQRPFQHFLERGGTRSELERRYPRLVARRKNLSADERDFKTWAKEFLNRVKDNEHYSFADFQVDYPGARHIYERRTRSGFPPILVIAEWTRRKVGIVVDMRPPVPTKAEINSDPSKAFRRLLLLARIGFGASKLEIRR